MLNELTYGLQIIIKQSGIVEHTSILKITYRIKYFFKKLLKSTQSFPFPNFDLSFAMTKEVMQGIGTN